MVGNGSKEQHQMVGKRESFGEGSLNKESSGGPLLYRGDVASM